MSSRVTITPTTKYHPGASARDQDLVAVESPLEVLLQRAGAEAPAVSLGLLMRTPGDDRDLVTGLLFTEHIARVAGDILEMRFEDEVKVETGSEAARPARVQVTLGPHIDPAQLAERRALDRTSACGMCGRLALQAIEVTGGARSPDQPMIDPHIAAALPDRLREGQVVFEETGGLHAAALCDLSGESWMVREDVGRHNAVDKVVGAALLAGRLPARASLLAVSGRVAYEIVHKAALAGVVGIVAVGAPTSLAVEAARSAGLTLIGFTRDHRFNVYAGDARMRRA